MATTQLEILSVDLTLPKKSQSGTLCKTCEYRGKSYMCLIPTSSKEGRYPNIYLCDDYKKKTK